MLTWLWILHTQGAVHHAHVVAVTAGVGGLAQQADTSASCTVSVILSASHWADSHHLSQKILL